MKRGLFLLSLCLMLCCFVVITKAGSESTSMAGMDGNCILSLLGRKAESPEVMKLKTYMGKAQEGVWQMGKTLNSKKGIQLLFNKDNIISSIKINISAKNQQLGKFNGRLPYRLSDTSSIKGVLYAMGEPLEKGKTWLKYYREGVNTVIYFSAGNISGLELNYKKSSDLLFDKYCEQEGNTPATGKNMNNQPSKGILIIQDDIQAAAETEDDNG